MEGDVEDCNEADNNSKNKEEILTQQFQSLAVFILN